MMGKKGQNEPQQGTSGPAGDWISGDDDVC